MKLTFVFAAVAFCVGSTSVLASPTIGLAAEKRDMSTTGVTIMAANLVERRDVNDESAGQAQEVGLVKRGRHKHGRHGRGRKGGMMMGPPPGAMAGGGGMGGGMAGGMPDMSAGQ
ncbi:uncharacterized protein FA14DRAFT_156809 [Meira miltonrushii]|uniref:Uncharacterized protein n=1 Tax=Meira miltonrushii TaxID=1280837 RepID=A0A316VF94_9BASI|nr:uncharacterized protein FA14DRAFT_156809 [Meira miltonrushii]PWN34145.1 hypothetical protein FA14DRAFT_156809 [Meira miltonrushii]